MMASTSLKLTSFGTTILVAIVALSCKDLIPWVSSTHLIRFSQFSEWAWPVLVEASAYNIQQQQWSIGALQWANRTGSRKNQINPREMCEGSGSSYSHCSLLAAHLGLRQSPSMFWSPRFDGCPMYIIIVDNPAVEALGEDEVR